MCHISLVRSLQLIFLILFLTFVSTNLPAAPPIFWCPDKPADQQYSGTQEAGCVPLVTKKDPQKEQSRTKNESQRTVNLNNLQNEVSRFLQQYNTYVACCSTDPSTLREVTDLETHANDLLEAIQTGMSGENMKIRGMTFHQVLGPVTKAKYNLQAMKKRLTVLGDSMDRMPSLGYFEAGVEKQRIAEEQDAIRRAYGPLDLQGSGNTGTGIQNTTIPTQVGAGGKNGSGNSSLPTRTGDNFGSADSENGFARTGADIGKGSSSGTDIGQTPSTGFGIGSTSDNIKAGPSIGN